MHFGFESSALRLLLLSPLPGKLSLKVEGSLLFPPTLSDSSQLLRPITTFKHTCTIFYSSRAILVSRIWLMYSSSISVFCKSTVSGINPQRQLPHWIILATAIPKIMSSSYWFLGFEEIQEFFKFFKCFEE